MAHILPRKGRPFRAKVSSVRLLWGKPDIDTLTEYCVVSMQKFYVQQWVISSIDDSFVDNCLFSKQSATLSKCSFVRATCISFFCQCFEVKQFCAGVSGPFISRGDAHEWLSCLQWSAFKLPSGKCLLVSLCRVRNSKAGARTIAYWSSIDIARFTETDL